MGEGLLPSCSSRYDVVAPAVRRQISRHAATLRRERTAAEDRVWQRLRNRQIGGFKWRFQHSVGRRIADFVCLEAMLVVEIDGSRHGEEVERRRTADLEASGCGVIRFCNLDAFTNLEVILATAQRPVDEGRRRPSPDPLPQAGED